MAGKINMITAYVGGRVVPTSPKEAYGHSTAAGRGYYSMAEMSDERTEDFLRAQKASNEREPLGPRCSGGGNKS